MTSTLFDDHAPQPPLQLELPIHHRTHAYLTSRTLADVKFMRPASACAKGGAKAAQRDTYDQLQAFKRQPVRREGDVVYVKERYAPPRSGMAGRLYSSGSQNLWGAARSLAYEGLAELDMQRAIHRILRFACRTFDVRTPQLDAFLCDPDGYLRDAMRSEQCSKARAKLLFQLAWTADKPLMRLQDPFLKVFELEARKVREALMRVTQLQWITDASNGAGSFVSRLSQLVEVRLAMAVLRALQARDVPVRAWVFDGLYVDCAHHNSTELQQVAYDACEAIAPGVGMTWGWKLPDPTVHDAAGDAVGTLEVPASFQPTAERANEWNPRTQPTYDDFADPRAGHEGEVFEGYWKAFSKTHCKVGATFVDSEVKAGTYAFHTEAQLVARYKHRVTFKPPTLAVDAGGEEYLVAGEIEPDFVQRWLKDHRMDPLYLTDGPPNYWTHFDCHPDPDTCPDECFNTWRGFAAEDMPPIDWASTESAGARAHLRTILGHLAMLCGLGVAQGAEAQREAAAQFHFLLALQAHLVQYPQHKVGIMSCLVGPKGCGKTMLYGTSIRR